MSNENQSNAAPKATAVTPAYVAFCEALKQRCQELGLPAPDAAGTETGLPQNAGYAFLRFNGGAALIVPKAVAAVKRLECHLSPDAMGTGQAPSKPNGRVQGVLSPADVTDDVLRLLVTGAKRPVSRPTRGSTQSATATATASGLSDEELATVIEGL